MKPAPSLHIQQRIALTPQLQQFVHLLQLSTPELLSEIERALADNPFLEADWGESGAVAEGGLTAAGLDEAGSGAGEADGGSAAEGAADERDAAYDSDDGAAADGAADGAADEWAAESASHAGDNRDALDFREAEETLAQHLHFQAGLLRLADEDAAALHFLIDALNPDGYLDDSLAGLAATLVEDGDEMGAMRDLVQRLQAALARLHALEPSGVGARDLLECLTLQLHALHAESAGDAERQATVETALALCALDDAAALLARRDVPALARAAQATSDEARAALALIGRLEPQPGRRFAAVTQNAIVPDVIVTVAQGGSRRWMVELNRSVAPTLYVHEAYASALQSHRGGPHRELARRLHEARGYAQGVRQRFAMVLQVAQAIAQHQQAFFERGEIALRPLAQRELARQLGVHESTVSRATTGKYMATPRGTYELKYFFTRALDSATAGEPTSAAAACARIRQLIAEEDPESPLSDGALADRLKAEGVRCARRTVAKYRESLALPTASERQTRAAR